MIDELTIEQHQSQLLFHRILYGILIALIFLVYCDMPDVFSGRYMCMFIGTVIICGLEVVFTKFAFWNRIWVFMMFTYVQYAFFLIMSFFSVNQNAYLTIGLSSLLLTFMFEYSYYSGISDNFINVRNILNLVAPAFFCVIIYFCIHGVKITWFLILMDYIMLCIFDVLLVRMFYQREKQLRNQIHMLLAEMDSIEGNNEELKNFKNRLEKVNEELNLQRVQLAQMNREIQQSNQELEVQVDILNYINRSTNQDIPAVMKYMIETIMRVRKLEFCGIYIAEGTCLNKHSYMQYLCTTDAELGQLSDMKYIYEIAAPTEEEHQILHQFPEEQYPSLSKAGINSLLVLPLILDGEKYGVIAIGSTIRHVFDTAIRFYDIIVPQFDLAIHNIRMYAQIRHIAQTDGLTGINNRTHFNKLFAEQMEKTLRQQKALTVALFDIDKFKRINDTYGHLVGDEVIKKIASITAHAIEETELGFICRYGGEEFVIALPDMSVEQALPIIQKLHTEIATTAVEAYGHVVTMNVSIGVSAYPELCDDVNQLIKRADWSMYYAKEHGRGQIKIDGPDVTEA